MQHQTLAFTSSPNSFLFEVQELQGRLSKLQRRTSGEKETQERNIRDLEEQLQRFHVRATKAELDARELRDQRFGRHRREKSIRTTDITVAFFNFAS